MKNIVHIRQTLDNYKILTEQVEKVICKKYKEKDIDVVGIYLRKIDNFGDVFVGTYRKHDNYLPTNEKRYMITFDEFAEEN